MKKISVFILIILLAACGKVLAETDQDYSLKGLDAWRDGRYEEAVEYFTKAIEINPESAYYGNRASAYSKLNDNEHAFADLNEAVKLDPNNYIALSNRAVYYFRKGEYDKCWNDLRICYRVGNNYQRELLQELAKASGGSFHNDPEFLKFVEKLTPVAPKEETEEDNTSNEKLDKEIDDILAK